METHITTLCSSAYTELRRISHIRPYLSIEATKTLMSAFVLSRLDYCNSLLYGVPGTSLDRLQRVQNNAAKIVCRKRKYDHVTPLLQSLHWLPVRARIEYKLATLCYRATNGLAPNYLSELLLPYEPARCLRSSEESKLTVPRVRLNNYGQRSFSVAGPSIWNSLPKTLHEVHTIGAFKSKLKTHLFTKYFGL